MRRRGPSKSSDGSDNRRPAPGWPAPAGACGRRPCAPRPAATGLRRFGDGDGGARARRSGRQSRPRAPRPSPRRADRAVGIAAEQRRKPAFLLLRRPSANQASISPPRQTAPSAPSAAVLRHWGCRSAVDAGIHAMRRRKAKAPPQPAGKARIPACRGPSPGDADQQHGRMAATSKARPSRPAGSPRIILRPATARTGRSRTAAGPNSISSRSLE